MNVRYACALIALSAAGCQPREPDMPYPPEIYVVPLSDGSKCIAIDNRRGTDPLLVCDNEPVPKGETAVDVIAGWHQ